MAYDVAATVVWLRWAHSVEHVALDRYEVFRVDGGGTLTRVREVYQYPPVNSAQISGLAPNTTYTFVVQARDEVGHLSPLSAPVRVTTLPPPPPSCAVRSVVRQWSDGFVAHTGRNPVIPPGGTVSLGIVASGTQLPEEVTLNGGLCTVADE
ncbi:fibronectin type III domain-containing protein [Micromonospora ureilytica]|uniref:fibronectin type III domain-containing protein n=1 Tax=Micromonospora ureilytica TaxID=709868 RepID=UPI00403A1042